MAGRRELTAIGWRVIVEQADGTELVYGPYPTESAADSVLRRVERALAREAGELPPDRRRRRGKPGQLSFEGWD